MSKSVKEMVNEISSAPESVKKLRDLQQSIELIAKRQRKYVLPFEKPELKIGIIGDTHVGSLYHRGAALAAYYQAAEAVGCTHVLVAGDILAGWKVYKGQEFELRDRGIEEQLQRVKNEWPRSKMETLFITGNHDASFKNLVGANVGAMISNAREDLVCIGEDQATVCLGDRYRIMLTHPGGGTAYAISYRPQKIVESLAGGRKPNMLCVGHYHKAEFLPSHRNVAILQVGTFESQTPFMARQASAAHVGGWIVSVRFGDKKNGCNAVNAEFISFYEEKE